MKYIFYCMILAWNIGYLLNGFEGTLDWFSLIITGFGTGVLIKWIIEDLKDYEA